jgi:2-polyprenyl-6-methoxyphenol hydroxylase-like FAD-dependent oxidoreductase
VIDGIGCSPVFPRHVLVSGAGSLSANGIYHFAGEINHRPFFRHATREECLWYFNSCPLSHSTAGVISYNGWYLSQSVGTSSYNSAEDRYTSYSCDCVPQLELSLVSEMNSCNRDLVSMVSAHTSSKPPMSWVVRSPGLPPLAGCGIAPVPTVQYLLPGPSSSLPSAVHDSSFVMLLRLSLPNGEMSSLAVSEFDTILRVKLVCEELLHVPFYRLRLMTRGRNLSHISHLEMYSTETENDHHLILSTGLLMGDLISVEIISASVMASSLTLPFPKRRVSIIGAGPVGLWIAIQLKILRGDWTVTCYEKRRSYERSHALSISPRAFEGMVEWCPGRPGAAELSLLKDRWIPRTRTSIVESDLKTLAQSLGVGLVYSHEVISINELVAQQRQHAHLVICCDGAKSSSRSQLSCLSLEQLNASSSNKPRHSEEKEEFKHQKQLGSLLQVKFDAHGEVHRANGQLAQFLQNLPATEEFFNILPGNYDSDRCSTPMTIFALLSSEVTQSIQSSSSSPHDLERMLPPPPSSALTALPPSALQSDLEAVLSELCNGGIVDGSMQTSVLPVAYAVSRTVVEVIDDTPIFLAGDAAMGLPLEKGLNYGWKIASRLCHYLAHSPDTKSASFAFQTFFDQESESAVEAVEQHYSQYVQTIESAGALRGFLRPFASFFITTKVAVSPIGSETGTA